MSKKYIDKQYLLDTLRDFDKKILKKYDNIATKSSLGKVKPDNKTIFVRDDGTIYAVGGNTSFDVGDVLGASYRLTKNTIILNWTDPDNLVANDKILATWQGTIIVKKENSAPLNIEDGTVIINSINHNAYSSIGFEDTDLEYGKTYYYKFFTYTTDDIYYEDGTCLSISPLRTVVELPIYNDNLVYNGMEQTANFINYTPEKFQVVGNTGVDAGQYTAIFTPKSDFCWFDGTSTGKNVSWNIEKADGSISIIQNDITLNYENPSTTINFSDSTGQVTVSSSNSDIAIVSLTDSTITISSPNEQNGTATIVINVSASDNHNATSININVMAVFMQIPTWSNATDEELLEILEKAYSGEINLSDYWKVGDERKVELSAMPATYVNEKHVSQTVTFVLMNAGGKILSDQETDDVECQFIVGQKNVLADGTTAEEGYMHSSYGYGWHNSKRRTWCNNIYYNSLPESFRILFKKFKNVTIEKPLSSNLITTEDYFAIPSSREVANNGNEGEGAQFLYYKTSANKIKKIGNTSTATSYWTRSPSSSLKCTRAIKRDGGTYAPETTSLEGITPFGCI